MVFVGGKDEGHLFREAVASGAFGSRRILVNFRHIEHLPSPSLCLDLTSRVLDEFPEFVASRPRIAYLVRPEEVALGAEIAAVLNRTAKIALYPMRYACFTDKVSAVRWLVGHKKTDGQG